MKNLTLLNITAHCICKQDLKAKQFMSEMTDITNIIQKVHVPLSLKQLLNTNPV